MCLVLESISSGPATHSHESEDSDSHGHSIQIWYEYAVNTPSQVGDGVDFRGLVFVLHISLLLLWSWWFRCLFPPRKNGIVSHSTLSVRVFIQIETHLLRFNFFRFLSHFSIGFWWLILVNCQIEEQQFFMVMPSFILHDRCTILRKNVIDAISACALPKRYFDVKFICDSSPLPLFYSGRVLHEWHRSDPYSSHFTCFLYLPTNSNSAIEQGCRFVLCVPVWSSTSDF